MADNIFYRDAIVKTTLKKLGDENTGYRLVLDLPFNIYSSWIISNGKELTYRLQDLKLEGTEVIAKIDYKIEDEEKVKKFTGTLATKYEDNVLKNADYTKHYSVTKAEKLATHTALDEKVLYDGADKDEIVPFCEALVFTKPVVEEVSIGAI